MDGQRQTYVPAPPPPSMAQASQSHMVSLPPPPPRHPPTQTQGLMLPPPPGPPPVTGYGVPTKIPNPQMQHPNNLGWQPNWRPAMPQTMPQAFPPPPPPPPLIPANQAQNQHLVYGRQPAPLSIPPTQHHHNEGQPLTSATYIPVGDTFGPGVGIPAYDTYNSYTLSGDRHRIPTNHLYEHPSADSSPYKREATVPHTPSSRNVPPSSIALHDNVHELTSPQYTTATLQSQHPQSAVQATDLSKSPSHRHNSSSTSLGGMSPSEAAVQWPLHRVLLWLAKNAFSNDWQETFKALELQGADFLELGHGSNGRGNFGKMHQVVYPQLAKECEKSGTAWDQVREREEGKRMRRLIREIHDDGSHETGFPTQKRQEPQPFPVSATAERGVEASPKVTHEPLSAGPHTGSPGLKAPQLHNNRNSGQMRSVTLPISTNYDSSSLEPNSHEATTWSRSEYSRNLLATLGGDHRKSPSVSSDGGQFSAARPYDSPKSGSPATQHASLAYQGLTSSSTGDLSVKFDHSRGNSTDSTTGASRGHSGRYYEGRKHGQDNSRPQDSFSRQWSADNPSSYSKEHSKGILNIFKKKQPKASESTHPSPEEQYLESPTSPVYSRHHNSHFPYIRPSYSTSDVSLAERPLSTSMSDNEKTAGRVKPGQKGKKWVFVTLDGWNYRLVDITDLDSVEMLRAAICQNLGITDWAGAQIFLTEAGQTEHEDPLNDSTLAIYRRTKSDSVGSLKLYVRGANIHSEANGQPHFAGLGVSILDKATASPTTGQHHLHRKPLDDEALSRVSPRHQARPGSPQSATRQQQARTPTGKLPARDISQTFVGVSPVDGGREASQNLDPEKADLLARHEEHKRDVERKQRAHNITKVPPTQQSRKDAYGETGYRREGVIDFDSPRISPYEDKKAETLVPLRKPPSAPHESNTLTKVNSLRKKDFDRTRPQPAPQGGLGAALASMGKMTSTIGNPSPAVPAGTASQHSDAGRPSSSRNTPDEPRSTSSLSKEQWNDSTSTLQVDDLNDKISSGEEPKPTLQSRKSYGPEFDFEETKVSFQRSPQPQEDSDNDDSDDDSDDGLFAIPLANNKPEEVTKEAAPESPESEKKAGRPSLTLNTDSRMRKGLSVTFDCPSATAENFPKSGSEANDGRAPFSGMVDSPEDEKLIRRGSFAQGDIWANRPPVEGVIDRLDDFFPDIDLDAPYLEGHGMSPPTSPASRLAAENEARDKDDAIPYSGQPSHTASDILGSPEPTLKAQRDPGIVARRNVTRSGGGGGLTRGKSIRDVAKSANQASRNRSVTAATSQKSGGDILRRKSTKMFGAKIMQIRPKRGMSQLDPIPQHNHPQPQAQAQAAQGNVPQRQPTFRIVRGQLIGKGTYGRVYLGINADNGEVLAVKQVEVNPRIAGQDKDKIKEMVAAMDQEIDTMQHLEHPNIVQYLGCERGELSISIYLEYISGGSIGSCLRKHGKFEESVVKSLGQQVLSGLAYLHDQGILHRDLKADNILLDLDGTCKISDFGISKKTDNIYGNDSTNSMQGSVFWMAPEVIQSQGQGYSAKVDIWSLGCVVLEMFAGRRPWSREEAIGAIFKLGSLNQAPPIPEDVSMNISPAALAFMYDCFTVDSLDRPTAETLLTRHPFCAPDPKYNFLDTELYAKIRHVV
ncbi:mitogen-activated protein kinase kinase kinase [Aspergillus wentii]|nr:hypothetical protein MW887_001455 [Aspergillus wentii]